jgi:hypothetical protein
MSCPGNVLRCLDWTCLLLKKLLTFSTHWSAYKTILKSYKSPHLPGHCLNNTWCAAGTPRTLPLSSCTNSLIYRTFRKKVCQKSPITHFHSKSKVHSVGVHLEKFIPQFLASAETQPCFWSSFHRSARPLWEETLEPLRSEGLLSPLNLFVTQIQIEFLASMLHKLTMSNLLEPSVAHWHSFVPDIVLISAPTSSQSETRWKLVLGMSCR